MSAASAYNHKVKTDKVKFAGPNNKTLVSASSVEKDLKKDKVNKIEVSNLLGEILAKRAKEKNINDVYFDRGQNKYHGRIKVFAESLRKNGIKF